MKSAYTFILVIYSYFVFETVILCDRGFKKRQTEPSCPDESEYTCLSGQCIDIATTCDGTLDCSDGSDETEALCASTTCPTYGFKCTYGACINIEGRCDGVIQCTDGSDEEQCSSQISSESEENSENNSAELTSTASTTTTSETTTSETTTPETITPETTTPETTESTTTESTTTETTTKAWKTTASTSTPWKTTVSTTKAWKTTESTSTPWKTTPWKTTESTTKAWKTTPWKTTESTSTPWKTTESTSTPWKTTPWKTTESTTKAWKTTPWKTTESTTKKWNIPASTASSDIPIKQTESINYSSHQKKTCAIPTIEGTKHFYKDSIQNVPLSYGSEVDQYRIVEEDCEEGYYKTVPYKLMVCAESGKWKSFVSDTLCLKKCPPMVSDVLDIKCSLNGYNVNCSKPLEPGTILTQSCKIANSYNLSRNQRVTNAPNELLCLQNAKWNGELLTTCTSNNELTTSRIKESSTIAPWNVEIYKINNYGRYFRICGGTLIAPNLVVSAAHCFWKKGLRWTVLPNENNVFKTAVGKETSNFSIKDNAYSQIIDIKLIYLKESYDGPFGMYADDISVVVLANNIAVSNGVWPASIDWSARYSLSNGDLGKMFGLGLNNAIGNGKNKTILKLYYLPYINRETCQEMYTNGFENYVTKDKFCTGYKLVSGEKHLIGFGGSGLMYKYNAEHFLTGILSVKDLHSNKSIAVFTSIKCHVNWIHNIYKNHVDVYNKYDFY